MDAGESDDVIEGQVELQEEYDADYEPTEAGLFSILECPSFPLFLASLFLNT